MERFPFITKIAKHYNKPILLFDLETTGLLNVKPVGIVEIGIVIIFPDGSIKSLDRRFHPGIDIPLRATQVHNIRNSDIKNHPKFDSVIPLIAPYFHKSVISGFNSNSYDIPVLNHNFERYGFNHKVSDHNLDVRTIWKKFSGGTKGTLTYISQHLNVPAGVAHSALGDIQTTINILEEMIRLTGWEQFKRLHLV